MWTPDGRSLVFFDDQSNISSLLRISADGGAAVRETTYPSIGSFTRDGVRFVYSQRDVADPPSIWKAAFSAPGGSLLEKNKIISSQFPELDAQPSPDGTRIVWMSMRTGARKSSSATLQVTTRFNLPISITFPELPAGLPTAS